MIPILVPPQMAFPSGALISPQRPRFFCCGSLDSMLNLTDQVAQAVKRGLKVVKFFPAEPAGGVSMIKAMAAPYVGIKFMPTGGINAKNLEDYLSFDKIICCGGSWMVKGDLVKAGEFDKIKELTAEARKLADSIRK